MMRIVNLINGSRIVIKNEVMYTYTHMRSIAKMFDITSSAIHIAETI